MGLAVVLGAVFLVALAPRIDTDLWWHLKDGAYIWAHRAVPTRDFLSFTAAGSSWTDHEWLAELLLYGLYQLGGLWATIFFFAGVITLTYGLVYRRMAAYGVNRMLALFVLLAAFVSAVPTWGARPQMLTLLFLAVYALVLDRFRRTRNARLLVWFPGLMLVWANSHGGWVLGLVLLVVTVIGEWVNSLVYRGDEDVLAPRDLQLLGLAILGSLVAAVITPNGLHGLLYPLVWIVPTAYANVLSEWVSTDFHQLTSMVFEAMLLTLMVALFASRQRFNWAHILLIVAFTHLALSESRNVAVWSVVISPLLAFYLQRAIIRGEPAAESAPSARAIRPRTQRLLNIALLVMVALLYPIEALHFVNPRALQQSENANFPRGALAFMQSHSLPSRTFAQYAWGGYLLWKGYPRYRDFIDGRANTLFSTRLLNAYLDASSAAPDWRQVLDSYHVQNVLIPPGLPLAQVLRISPGWQRVYHDRTAVLFTRRGS